MGSKSWSFMTKTSSPDAAARGFHATHAQCQLGALCRAPWGARGEWKRQRKASWPLPGDRGRSRRRRWPSPLGACFRPSGPLEQERTRHSADTLQRFAPHGSRGRTIPGHGTRGLVRTASEFTAGCLLASSSRVGRGEGALRGLF